ncbi:MAG TPA: cation:proton antiporter [Chitinophagales bacterium]|nr:cation:proton antiporter [Chitinophagales bacterium]
MTTTIIIAICLLLLLAYVFDISAAKTKIPTVILLLLLGWSVRQATDFLTIPMPDFEPILPGLGTIGLILIVLEGSLELELNRSKIPVIKKSSLAALIPLLVLAFGIAGAFSYFTGADLKTALVNAVPLCVISSSIAIPSSKNLSANDREFVVYESSLSDIFGVLLFNFVALNETITAKAYGNFGLELFVIIVLSFVSVAALSFLLSRIQSHVTYTPIILLVILIYAVSKVFHLPGLIFILIFGLFLGNLDELAGFKWIEKLRPEKLGKEVHKFKEITVEATFLVRALFFIVFGFLLETSEILSTESVPWAAGIVTGIVVIRYIVLKLLKLNIDPLISIAPRGLITILLFLSIAPEQAIPVATKPLVVQVMLLSVLVMMIGLMASNSKKSVMV